MKKTYLIYKPVLDYEDSITPLIACTTKKKAEALRQELIDWCISTEKKLPQPPLDEWGNISDDKDAFADYETRRWEAWGKLYDGEFPYGLTDLKGVFCGSQKFAHEPESFLSIMELDVV